MNSEELFKKRLARLDRWVKRASQAWQKALSDVDSQYLNLLRDLEEEKAHQAAQFKNEEEQLKGQIDQSGKDFAKNKYLYEKESTQKKEDIEKAQREIEKTKQHMTAELARINQEKLN